MRMLTSAELRTVKGIPFTLQWLCKLVRDGHFPKPVKLGTGHRNLWLESEIDDYIARKLAERDQAA
jgi:predicted DNA-binding transcriptional regulator AlpA